MAVDGGLHLRVTEFRGRAHQHAMECVRTLAAIRRDHQTHSERAACFARTQRTQIVGDALRQHRHDAIREVDRVAAQQRVAIQRRSRPHVKRDVGDGDVNDVATLVSGIVVRHRVHSVVVILGVRRVDGDQRNIAPVLAALQSRGRGRLGFLQRGG